MAGKCEKCLFAGFLLAGELGFEPRQTESESVVLPLHHSPPKALTQQRFFRKFCNQSQEFCKPGDLQRPYSRAGVRGLVLVVDETKPLLAVSADLHLVAEPHVMPDVLARHADIVGDLVNLIALLGAGEDSGPAEPVDGRMVGVVRIEDHRLEGTLWGEPVDVERHAPACEPKGATYTALKVAKDTDGRWSAACIVDV